LGRLGADDVEALATADCADVCALLRGSEPVDCLIADADATGLDPADLHEALEPRAPSRPLPVVLYGPRRASPLRRSAGVLLVREARSLARLMDLVYFFLHRRVADLPADERESIEELHRGSRVLEGKKALIVDDDMRNIFALSTVLYDQGMEMVSADNGHEAVRLVREDPSIDIVLMDIMMPEMDGLATMQEIRKLGHRPDLPIIAVTAKAMKGDREKCIEAGAWDYLAKPVDTVRLLSVLRGWLHR